METTRTNIYEWELFQMICTNKQNTANSFLLLNKYKLQQLNTSEAWNETMAKWDELMFYRYSYFLWRASSWYSSWWECLQEFHLNKDVSGIQIQDICRDKNCLIVHNHHKTPICYLAFLKLLFLPWCCRQITKRRMEPMVRRRRRTGRTTMGMRWGSKVSSMAEVMMEGMVREGWRKEK